MSPSRGTTGVGAAIFNADHARLGEAVAETAAAGADFLHLDVFDGRLVRDLAFPPRTIAALRPLTDLSFEVHLVAGEPTALFGPLAEAGADLVLVHVEGAPMLYEVLAGALAVGLRVGVAAGLATPLETVLAALPHVEAVCLLSRLTGEATAAPFDPAVLPRLRVLRAAIDESGASCVLQVAGGLGPAVAGDVVAAGADALVLGSALYRAEDPAAVIAACRAERG